jgi:hypothetical protein
VWKQALLQAIDPAGPLGEGISQNEFLLLTLNLPVLSTDLPERVEAPLSFVADLLHRLNDSWTFYNSRGGNVSRVDYQALPEPQRASLIDLPDLLERAQVMSLATERAQLEGYSSVFAALDDAVVLVGEAAGAVAQQGVCAAVVLRIEQELVLTRNGFEARLEVSNTLDVALANLTIELVFYDDGEFDAGAELLLGDVAGRFSYGMVGSGAFVNEPGSTLAQPKLRLPPETTALATWLIIPRSTAAPNRQRQYRVAGSFSYSVDGKLTSAPLVASPIRVYPDARLVVRYFWEKLVWADDPMTLDVVEPSLPFSLAVAVTNIGGGAAERLNLASGQPKIVENEKGLLIAFEIVASQKGPTTTGKGSLSCC